MSGLAATPPGFAPRGADVKEAARVFKVVDDLERERRIRRLVTIGGGWNPSKLNGFEVSTKCFLRFLHGAFAQGAIH